MLTDQEIDAITAAQWGRHADHLMPAYRAYARAIERAATAPLLAAIEDQKRTIIALNSAINGSESTTTENLTIVGRLERRIAHLEATASMNYGRGAADEHARVAELEAENKALRDCLRCIADQLERVGDTRMHKDGQFIADARALLDGGGHA